MLNIKREYFALEEQRLLYQTSFKDKSRCYVYGKKKFITEAGEEQLSAHAFPISKDFWTISAGQLDFTNYVGKIWEDYLSVVIVEHGEYTSPSINFGSMGDITPENLQELSNYISKHLSDLEKRIVEDYLFIDEGVAENKGLPNLPENHFWVRKNGVIVGVNLDYLKIDYDYLKNNMEADFNTVSKEVYNVFKNNVDSYIVDKNKELQGATFFPHLIEDGTLSWTNDKNKPNPEPVNIKGPSGTIENVTASVNSNAGTPSVKVTMSGTKENRSFNLEFQNLKGDMPVKGEDYYTPAEKEQFTTETIKLVTAEGNSQVALVSTEGQKVIEQVKKLVGVNPAGGDAVSVGGLTRPEIEKGINDNLINAVNIAKNGIFNYRNVSDKKNIVFAGSIFSGWKQKITIVEPRKAIGVTAVIKARDTAITKIRFEVSLNGILVNDYTEDILVEAKAEKEIDIHFLKELNLKTGDILEIAYRCNQLCDCVIYYTVEKFKVESFYAANGELDNIWANGGPKDRELIFHSFLYNNKKDIDNNKKDIDNNKKDIGILNSIPIIENENNIFSLCDTKNPVSTAPVNEAIKGIGFYINKSDLFNTGNVVLIRMNQFNIKSTGKREKIIVEILDVNKTVLKQYETKFLPNNTDDYIIKVFFDKDDFTSFPNDLILGIRTDTAVAPSYDTTFKYKSKNEEINSTDTRFYKYSCYYTSDWVATSVGARNYLCPNVEFYYSLNIKTDTTLTDKYLPANSFKVGKEIERIDKNINRIENIINSGSESSLLKLPERFDLVVGDTFELFYKGIINVSNTDIYDVTIDCNKNIGQAYKRKYVYTPKASEVGQTTVTFNLIDNLGNKLESKQVIFNIVNVPINPSEVKNILCVGDSLTTGGEWANEFRKRLIGTSSHIPFNITNVNFLGIKEREGTKYEGYGGWAFNSYLTANKSTEFMYVHGTFDKTVEDQHSVYKDTNGTQWKLETITPTKIKIIRIGYGTLPATGTLTWVSGGQNHSNIVYTSSEQAEGNPFWNAETQSVDFLAYAKKFNVSNIDYVYILLGWNNTGTNAETYTNQCKQFIDLILKDFPNCKIGLIGLQVPSQNGFGQNYGIDWKYYDKLQHIWKLQEIYQTISKEPQYTGKVDYINISAQFDSEYNMPHTERNANIRTTQKEYVQTNGVHPANDGYMQIADAVTRNFLTKI